MLHAVVACGSFANAAEFLHVSQPAISYAIAKLEDQLGVRLLKLEGRKARITEAGNALLDRSRFLLREAIELEKFAENLRNGHRPELRLAVSQDFPTQMLITALRNYTMRGETAKVHLMELSVGELERILQHRATDLAINNQVPPGFYGDLLTEMEYVAVAHPDHPLFRLKREVTQADLDREMHIVSNPDIAPHIKENMEGSCASQKWRVSSLETAQTALSECLGYGWLPKHKIQKSLDNGELKILPLRSSATYKANFYLIHGRPPLPSSDASRLAEALHSVASVAI
jgi:DNA-binding transcriptional LysR family regulator